VLSFVAARLGAKKVYGCDLSEPAVEMARENAASLGLDDVCEFRYGDLLEPVRDVRASVLIGDVSGIPDELAAVSGWFDRVPSGGPTGAELPVKLLRSIDDTLAPGGRLYLPTGTIQDEEAIIAAAREVFGDNMEPVLEREFPLPELVAKAGVVARMMKDGILNLRQRGSRLLWSLRIWRCVRPV
jgi:SAM-dependent methyltransferase